MIVGDRTKVSEVGGGRLMSPTPPLSHPKRGDGIKKVGELT